MKILAIVLLVLHFTLAPTIPLWACLIPVVAGFILHIVGFAIIAAVFVAITSPPSKTLTKMRSTAPHHSD